jgi:hypothetical protein
LGDASKGGKGAKGAPSGSNLTLGALF